MHMYNFCKTTFLKHLDVRDKMAVYKSVSVWNYQIIELQEKKTASLNVEICLAGTTGKLDQVISDKTKSKRESE